MCKYSLILWLLLQPVFADAVVFRCERPGSQISYQEFPCDYSVYSQTMMPISGVGTTKNINNRHIQAEIKRNSKYLQKTIIADNKKQLRQQKARQRSSEKNREKAFKRKLRCDTIKLKVQLLHNRLRAGYTAKQEVRIKEQLAHYAEMEKQYCD